VLRDRRVIFTPIWSGPLIGGFSPGPGARDDIGRIHALGKPLDSQLREHRAVIGQMMAVHDVSMRIDISVAYQSPFLTVSVEVGLSGGTLRHLKVRAVLVGKKAVEDMIALGACWLPACRCPARLAVEVASNDPEQGDGLVQIVELVERIEVALAILIGVVFRRGVEGDEQQLVVLCRLRPQTARPSPLETRLSIRVQTTTLATAWQPNI